MYSTYGQPETPAGWFDLTLEQQALYIIDFCNWGTIIFAEERGAHEANDLHIHLHERFVREAEQALRRQHMEPPI